MTTVALLADKDAYVEQTTPTTNRGTGTLQAGASGPPTDGIRALFSFDLSSIPSAALVSAAKLTMTCNGNTGTSTTLNLHKLTADFTELAVTWNTQPSFDAVALASSITFSDTAGGSTDVTGLAATVSAALGGRLGMLIKHSSETVSGLFYRSFAPRDDSTYAGPTLTVTYTVPGMAMLL